MDKPVVGTDDFPLTDPPPPRGDEAPNGVRRVNNVPLIIIGCVLAVFVTLVALVALQRGGKKDNAPAEAIASLPENSQILDEMLAHGVQGGLIPDPDEDRVPSFPVARVEDRAAPPLPERTEPVVPLDATDTGTEAVPRSDPAADERMKLFQNAMRARTAVARAAGTVAPADPRLNAASAGSEGERDEVPAAGKQENKRIPIHAEGDYAQFDNASPGKEDRWALGTALEAPRTRYEVRAGAVIPAVMISGINSDLPGQIIGQVSQDVYDTPTGKYRLIPQGSRLIGRYSHNVVYGQSRLLVAWQRIVFPDGKALDIGAMDGVDSAGYAGFGDKTDEHYVRIFGSAILMSGITSGLTKSRTNPKNDPFGSSNAAIMSQQLAQQLGQVATSMIERNLDIAPTLNIRPGYRFNVMAIKDLPFDRPYRAFAY